ncbi:MAG: hypothetical protein J6B32_05745 [Spirochaetaceae bacterium]|nr:hypothetical protein [Spirochaetaceae bacterium]
MKKIFTISVLLFLFTSIATFGQSADIFSEIIEAEELTVQQAAYIPCSWLNPQSDLSFQDAFSFFCEKGWLDPKTPADEPISLKEFSGICMKTWNIPGGLMYKITKSNWYAFKELRAKGFLHSYDDPSMKVSGEKALDLIYQCMEYAENRGL